MIMQKENKASTVTAMHEKFLRARVAIVTEYSGMPVNQMTQLRKQLRGAQAQMYVVKNTLAARALQDTPLVSVQPLLKGQLAMIIGYDDPALPTKILRKSQLHRRRTPKDTDQSLDSVMVGIYLIDQSIKT